MVEAVIQQVLAVAYLIHLFLLVDKEVTLTVEMVEQVQP